MVVDVPTRELAAKPLTRGFVYKLRLRALQNYKFGLAAFLIPLGIRAVPEIIAGQYPIGWDILAFYIPNSLDWASGALGPWNMVASPPLMYLIVVPVYLLTRSSLFLIFKVMGPVLFGAFCWSIFGFCRKRLSWHQKKALSAVLFIAAYFIVLRISWDAYQLELGLTFFLLAESAYVTSGSSKSAIFRGALLVLAVLSNQLAGVLVVGSVLLSTLRVPRRALSKHLLAWLPSAGAFLVVLYATFQTPLGPGLAVLGGVPAPLNFMYDATFLVYAYAFMVPMILLGARIVSRSLFVPWVVVCCFGIATSALPGHVFQDIGYRWALMLSVPLLLAAFEGFSSLRTIASNFPRVGVLKFARTVTIVGLVATAALYLGLPSQSAFSYFTIFPEFIPSSMIQSTLPLSEYQNVADAMLWINSHWDSNSALITHEAFYGWARAYLSTDKHIVNSYLYSPDSSLAQVDTYAHVLTIWWVPGTGWFEKEFPVGSTLAVRFGDIAVYQYR